MRSQNLQIVVLLGSQSGSLKVTGN